MHEAALCEGVLQVALEAAEGRPIQRIKVRVGRLHGVVPESWQLCWEMVAHGGPAAGSEVELVELPARVRCLGCGTESEVSAPPFACTRCGGVRVEVTAGEELVVEEVEVEGGEVLRNPQLPVGGGNST